MCCGDRCRCFIGSHSAEQLLKDDYAVDGLYDFVTGRPENLARLIDDVDIIEGDVQSYERAHAAVASDVVLTQAPLPSVQRSVQDQLMSDAVDVIGTRSILLRTMQFSAEPG